MKKHLKKVLALTAVSAVLAVSLAACARVEQQDIVEDTNNTLLTSEQEQKLEQASNIMQFLPGKWKLIEANGQKVPTNNRSIRTFNTDGTLVYTEARVGDDIKDSKWQNQDICTYELDGNNIIEHYESINGDVRIVETVNSINENELILQYKELTIAENTTAQDYTLKLVRVTENYKDMILGSHQGVSLEGEVTFGDENHRFIFKDDGTYQYLSLQEGRFVDTQQGLTHQYLVDGDYLMFRWQQTEDEFLYEYWDIEKLDETEMIWTATRMRDDGSSFDTKMVLKRL